MGCPHVTKIARKHENMAIEVSDMACGISEVCIFVEIQEGKEAMSKKEFVQQDFPTGTSFMLRATKAWQGTGRVVLGDSAFATVLTAVSLKNKGLYFSGHVKTASRFFPKNFFALIGYVGANAFKAAKLERNATDLDQLMDYMALQLLTNEYEGFCYPKAKKQLEKSNLQDSDFVGGVRPAAGGSPAAPAYKEGMTLSHGFKPLSSLKSFQTARSPKKTCKICKDGNAAYFCVTCTDRAGGDAVAVCGLQTGRDCVSWHCQVST